MSRQEGDIETQRAELEAARAERDAARAEVDAFTRAISHDMAGSLGNISAFTELLKMRAADKLTDAEKDYLGFIESNIGRATRLLDGIRAWRHVGRSPIALVDLRADQLVRPNDRVQFSGETELRSDRHLLQTALGAVVDNALRFSEGPVEVRVTHSDGCRVEVQDHGIGVAPGFHEEIFRHCRRLHPPDVYPGAGMGLAVAERCITRLGGAMGVESAPDQGATF